MKKEIVIENSPIKTNGTVKKVLDIYKQMNVKRLVLMRDYLAVLKYKDPLVNADNPWLYYRNGILNDNIEHGMSSNEMAFELGAIKLLNTKPTDVINSAFYKNRNESGFEGYLLEQYIEKLNDDEDSLIINPSPYMILSFEERRKGNGKNVYVVTDDTIAGLYSVQFTKSVFYSFESDEIDYSASKGLLVVRDQKPENLHKLLDWVKDCDVVIAELPNNYFDNSKYGAYKKLADSSLYIDEIQLIDSQVFVTSPRKKMCAFLSKIRNDRCKILSSNYIKAQKILVFEDRELFIKHDDIFKTDLSLLQLWNKGGIIDKDNKSFYGEAQEYIISDEIHLFYSTYCRNDVFRGRAYYKGLKSVCPNIYGKKVSPLVEKGLRAKDIDEITNSLWKIALMDKVYEVIVDDLFHFFINENRPLSLLSLWFYLRTYLQSESHYDENIWINMFFVLNNSVSQFKCDVDSDNLLFNCLCNDLHLEREDLPISVLEQLNLLFKVALKEGHIIHNPLEGIILSARSRSSRRINDIRNVLVKKHFSENEERRIFDFLIEEELDNNTGKYLPRCVIHSIWLLGAIRLFSGISLREACALLWSDYVEIEDTKTYQFRITKFMGVDKIELHSDKEAWKKYRCVPVANILSELLERRRSYLRDLGVDIDDTPIVLAAEEIKSLKKGGKNLYCNVGKGQEYCRRLIKVAEIPENIVILPDAEGERTVDLYKYNGDIFVSNIRTRLNHSCKMTNGEISYFLGVDAPDTFSRHYCDYSNSLCQYAMVKKMDRGFGKYVDIYEKLTPRENTSMVDNNPKELIVESNNSVCCAAEIMITSLSSDNNIVDIEIECEHGADVEINRYRLKDI